MVVTVVATTLTVAASAIRVQGTEAMADTEATADMVTKDTAPMAAAVQVTMVTDQVMEQQATEPQATVVTTTTVAVTVATITTVVVTDLTVMDQVHTMERNRTTVEVMEITISMDTVVLIITIDTDLITDTGVNIRHTRVTVEDTNIIGTQQEENIMETNISVEVITIIRIKDTEVAMVPVMMVMAPADTISIGVDTVYTKDTNRFIVLPNRYHYSIL